MKHFFDYIYEKVKDNFFFKMYLLILLPVIFILIFMLFSTYFYSQNYKELLKTGYLERLESICTQNESSLQNITTIIEVLSENNDFMEIATANTAPEQSSVHVISDILSQVCENNLLIDSISIYNRSSSAVYTANGVCHSTIYYSNEYHYADYPKGYWDNYSTDTDDFKILPPSLVYANNVQKTVIPLVFTKLGNTETKNIVTVNVNLAKMLSHANSSRMTENSTFFVLSTKNRNVFLEESGTVLNFGNNFYTDISKESLTSFDCLVNGKRTLVMSYSPGNSILGYSYIATVPYTDINSRASHLTYIMMVVELFVLFLALFGGYYSAKKIYTPIEDLASMFEHDSSKQDGNTLRRLHSSIRDALDTNNSLYSEYTKVLPLVQERYLINLLNSNEHYTPEADMSDMPIDFTYEYFCSIVIRLKPTEEFYNLYNKSEYDAIKSGIHNIIQSEFNEKYEAYTIPSESDTLYVLLNLPNNTESEKILDILENFRSVMDFDKNYMSVSIGIGGIYPYISGLKKSHHEAINSVSGIIGLPHIKIEGAEKKPTYELSINDENTLLNHLILGHHAEARETLECILEQNINISDTALMQLYIQILNIIFKVMRMKKIDYDPENSGDFHIIVETIKQPAERIYETVQKYISVITEHTGTVNTKIDIQAVIAYIEDNYNKDLGLDSIADNFDTTPKYLSKLIKDKLGVNFVDYLGGLRIAAAKLLLSSSDKSISEIFEEVGFNNRNTFIRSFKKITGQTPSEYRKNNDGI